ncbi:MAG: hypothetical protein EAZ99_14115 [Alphaproteobacteria bacterium]|nr:MAG: hypothetical protein EAZ99_14115 [Alphaproteobacteria bacterium]
MLRAMLEFEPCRYDDVRPLLEQEHPGMVALIHQGELIAVYNTLDEAASDGVRRYGRLPFDLRELPAVEDRLPLRLDVGQRISW